MEHNSEGSAEHRLTGGGLSMASSDFSRPDHMAVVHMYSMLLTDAFPAGVSPLAPLWPRADTLVIQRRVRSFTLTANGWTDQYLRPCTGPLRSRRWSCVLTGLSPMPHPKTGR